MAIVIAIVVFGIAGWAVFMIGRAIWRMLGNVDRPRASSPNGTKEMTAEEEGNVHSGPYGYSPNTAYPETQYGSLFNPDAEWNHEEQ